MKISFRDRVAGSDVNLLWITPQGDVEEAVPTHTKWLINHDPDGIAEALSGSFPDEEDESGYEEAVFNAYLQNGWTRIHKNRSGLFIQTNNKNSIEKILQSLSKYNLKLLFAPAIIVNNKEVIIHEGEDALNAWKHRKDIRHRKVAYIGQSPHVPSGGPYTSAPDAPWNSQEMAAYTGMPSSSYFCPRCKSVNLFINQDENLCICHDCKARFSTEAFETGNSFEETEIPRATGLLNTDEGSTSQPSAHESGSIGGGSASTQWGRDVNYN